MTIQNPQSQSEQLSDRALAAGMGMACAEDDKEWLRKCVDASPFNTGIPADVLEEWLDLVLGWSTTPKEAREQGVVTSEPDRQG